MRIAIIGTGNVGGAIAIGLAGKGHAVLLGARDPDSAKVAALAANASAKATTPFIAVQDAEVVVLALPWRAAEAAISELGDLAGKTVIDCMNPLGPTATGLALILGHDTSGGEAVQRWLPDAHVVKTLNQVGAEMMARNDHLHHRPAMFMAGNDDTAKTRVAKVLNDLGFEALDAGDITKSRLLEPFGMVWINQALFREKGREWAFAAIS